MGRLQRQAASSSFLQISLFVIFESYPEAFGFGGKNSTGARLHGRVMSRTDQGGT